MHYRQLASFRVVGKSEGDTGNHLGLFDDIESQLDIKCKKYPPYKREYCQ